MKTLFFLLVSIFAFGQKDTSIVAKKVVVIGSVYFVQTTTTNIAFEPLDTKLLQRVESIEEEKQRRLKENEANENERKELVRMVKDAVKKGYKPPSDNS